MWTNSTAQYPCLFGTGFKLVVDVDALHPGIGSPLIQDVVVHSHKKKNRKEEDEEDKEKEEEEEEEESEDSSQSKEEEEEDESDDVQRGYSCRNTCKW